MSQIHSFMNSYIWIPNISIYPTSYTIALRVTALFYLVPSAKSVSVSNITGTLEKQGIYTEIVHWRKQKYQLWNSKNVENNTDIHY